MSKSQSLPNTVGDIVLCMTQLSFSARVSLNHKTSTHNRESKSQLRALILYMSQRRKKWNGGGGTQYYRYCLRQL